MNKLKDAGNKSMLARSAHDRIQNHRRILIDLAKGLLAKAYQRESRHHNSNTLLTITQNLTSTIGNALETQP
jgi:hypothetical protein